MFLGCQHVAFYFGKTRIILLVNNGWFRDSAVVKSLKDLCPVTNPVDHKWYYPVSINFHAGS